MRQGNKQFNGQVVLVLLGSIAGIALVYLTFPWAIALALHRGEAGPSVISSEQVKSPDRKMVATIEEIDNGLGFGQGMIYHEVHVTRVGEKWSGFGDHDPSVAFYMPNDLDDKKVEVEWIGSDRLLIRYGAKDTPGLKLRSLAGIEIQYDPY